jgi:hypothetical protein
MHLPGNTLPSQCIRPGTDYPATQLPGNAPTRQCAYPARACPAMGLPGTVYRPGRDLPSNATLPGTRIRPGTDLPGNAPTQPNAHPVAHLPSRQCTGDLACAYPAACVGPRAVDLASGTVVG